MGIMNELNQLNELKEELELVKSQRDLYKSTLEFIIDNCHLSEPSPQFITLELYSDGEQNFTFLDTLPEANERYEMRIKDNDLIEAHLIFAKVLKRNF